MGFVRALRLPQIALLWSGQVLSAMGDYLYTIAVLWITVRTLGSAAGFVAGAQALATFVFGLPGGVYADRWNRRCVMITADLLRAAAVACADRQAAVLAFSSGRGGRRRPGRAF